MIEIERKDTPERHARLGPMFCWHVRGRPEIGGISRQPLLDACRAFEAMGELPATQIGLFRPGRPEWDVRTTIGHGAGLTVIDETSKPRFGKWRQFKAWSQDDQA